MSRELKTERELLAIVVQALDARPETAGWIPTGLHEHEDDEAGCNWDIHYIHRDRRDADVENAAMRAAADVIGALQARYNLR
ncbi:hypothetical protein [Paraburkholderia sp.]|uniref:hypothetical protein n=1 Tax=Paraburkholderia sp. TaxID=1926495 RepID=UPI0023849FAC|nr:hypothetical protein [Paraburkholderia sp.]MDE1182438.1 hypothetical protein [Paraburkholderia sp.]